MEGKKRVNKMTDEKIPANLIYERWSYYSRLGTGSDHGTRAFVYCPSKNLAILLKTRDRMLGAQGGTWEPSDKEDHYYDESKGDLFGKSSVDCLGSLEEQIELFKSYRKDSESYEGNSVKEIFLDAEELEMLETLRNRKLKGIEPDSPVFTWLMKKLEEGFGEK